MRSNTNKTPAQLRKYDEVIDLGVSGVGLKLFGGSFENLLKLV